MGTFLLLAAGIGVAVKRETDRQVAEVGRTTIERARAGLRDFEQRERRLLDERLSEYTEGTAALAALEVFRVRDREPANGSGDELGGRIEYEILNRGLDDVFLSFHDDDGRTLWVRTADTDGRVPEAWIGGDPFDLLPLIQVADTSRTGFADGYRVIQDRVYRVQTHIEVEEGFVVGFVTDGRPVAGADLAQVGTPAPTDLCIANGMRCLAGPAGARGRIERLFAENSEAMYTEEEGLRFREDGTERHLFSLPLEESNGLSLAIAVDLTPILTPFRGIQRVLMLGTALSLVVAVVASGLLARGLTGPIRRLTQATRRVGAGDFDTEVQVQGRDEIGELAAAFNEMTEGLRLKERYRGVLQKVVAPEVAEELMRGDVVLGGETRRATVLFGDIRGFTRATQNAKPQEVIELLNEVMEQLAAAVDDAGGVVDKFVGDEIMAIFGAPVSRGDDAARAVDAAVEMQRRMTELNRGRIAGGRPEVGLGIGINTGELVAGNMGSSDRLNYTVLGAPVNLASRLCSAAAAGEILVGAETASESPNAAFDSAGDLTLKGFDVAIPVFRVAASNDTGGPARARVSVGKTLLAMVAAGAVAGSAPMQAQEWPTIRDDAWWASADGNFEAGLSGRLELDGYSTGADGAGLLPSGTFVAPRFRLFFDLFAGDDLHILLEARADRGDVPGTVDARGRIEQAWVRLGGGSVPVALQLGRIPSPVGGYAGRHLGPEDPFIRPPVPYDQRTVLSDRFFPGDEGALLFWKEEPETFRARGLPPIWQVPYPWGARLDVGRGTTGFHVAVVNSAPSSVPEAWRLTEKSLRHPTLVLGARTSIGPAWRLAAWASRGPWLKLDKDVPGYDELFSYDQTLFGGQAEWRGGGTLARAELWFDAWEVPFTATPGEGGITVREMPWSVELQQDLRPGVYVAGRVGGLRHRPIETPAGGQEPWDDDFVRAELAAGYRLARNAGLVASISEGFTLGPREADDGRISLRLWWDF